jgi:hypothetical protein
MISLHEKHTMKRKIFYDGAYYSKNEVLKIIEVTNRNDKGENDLYLGASLSKNLPDFALLNDLHQSDWFLSTHKIFSSSYINQLILANNYFAPLLNAIALTKQNGNKLKPKAITILTYYYLSESSISISFIEHWLVSIGYAEVQAGELAMAVYVARTERDDCTDIFYPIASDDLSQTGNNPNLQNIPSKEAFFRSDHHQNQYSIVYDDLAAYELLSSGNDITVVNCKDIPETAFMVEDHHHIILGLSIKLCEALALCECSATPFYKFIMGKCSYAETTYTGLGYFLNKYSIGLAAMVKENDFKISIRAIDNQQNTKIFSLEKGISLFSSQTSDNAVLPIFIDIEKL